MEETTFTLIADREDPETHEGWPYPTKHRTSIIDGPLAAKIREKFGAPATASVVIEEEEVSGGWSEYTQETDYNFTVRCAGHEHEFSTWSGYDNGLRGLLEWLGEAK